MLNDWSDRPKRRPRRPGFLHGEFWLGIVAIAVIAALLLSMVILPISKAKAQEFAPESNWWIFKKTDPITDRATGSAILESDDGKSKLIIACNGIDETLLSVQFVADKYLGSRSGTVQVRVNKGEVLPIVAWEFQSKAAATFRKPWINIFAGQLGSGSDQIVVRALDFRDQPHDGVFQSENGAAAFRLIAEMCGVKAN